MLSLVACRSACRPVPTASLRACSVGAQEAEKVRAGAGPPSRRSQPAQPRPRPPAQGSKQSCRRDGARRHGTTRGHPHPTGSFPNLTSFCPFHPHNSGHQGCRAQHLHTRRYPLAWTPRPALLGPAAPAAPRPPSRAPSSPWAPSKRRGAGSTQAWLSPLVPGQTGPRKVVTPSGDPAQAWLASKGRGQGDPS